MRPARNIKNIRNRRKNKNSTLKKYRCRKYLRLQDRVSVKVVKEKSMLESSGIDVQGKLAGESYDIHLLGKALTQWQVGDWNGLAKHSLDNIESHPERAMLTLLVAAGHLQNNDLQAAKQFVWLAKEWGCSKDQIGRILIAGVHNSLGCAAAVAGQQPRAFKHFKSAISIGTPECETTLIANIRMAEQLGQINNFVDVLQKKGHIAGDLKRGQSFHIIKKLAAGRNGELINRIVIGGMRHSASTALFNIIRLSLCRAGLDYIGFYSEQKNTSFKEDTSRKILLIKIHEFRDDIAFPDSLIITTRRDLRDTVASAVRRGFPLLKKIGNPVEYAKYNRILYDVWSPISDYIFVYEDFINNPIVTINKLITFIGLEDISAKKIYEEVLALPLDQYKVTLLTPSHITDPEHKLTFNDTLDAATIAKINSDHTLWLDQYNYK